MKWFFRCTFGLHTDSLTVEWQRALFTPVRLTSLFAVAKAPAPLVQISDYRPQTKGETTSPRFCSLVCSYCPVCKKIKLRSLRYIHHLTFLARVGSARWVCGDLGEFFWSSANSVLKRHQENAPLIFFFLLLFWLLLNFCTESRQGVLPVGALSIVPLKMERVKTDCFSGSGGEEQAPKSLQQLSPPPFWDVFRASLLCLSGVWSVFHKGLASVSLLTLT